MTLALSQFAVKFGTSYVCGLVSDLTPDYCWTFVGAFLQVLGGKPRHLLVGHDLRPSSPAIAAACIAAAESLGVACRSAGALPTPALALAGRQLGLPAIMITGSHIPADRNGIKAYRADGEITKADEAAMVAAAVEVPKEFSLPGLPAADQSLTHDYVRRYLGSFGETSLEGLRIGVYEHSTVARDIFHDVLRGLGAQTVAIARSDTFLPVDTEAIRQEDRDLARESAAGGGFDAIVSADGDADRPLLADEAGEWLRGDVLGLLAGKALGARSVVTPVSSTTAIEKSRAFKQVLRTRIGSPYVIAGMEAANEPPVAGFEANGGFLLGSDVMIADRRLPALPTRDAILPVLAVLAEARRRGVPISTLAGELPARFTFSDRLQDFATEHSRRLIDRLAQDAKLAGMLMAPESGGIEAVDRTDGFRVTFANGNIVHLRPSGNAPELRCYAEASTERQAEGLVLSCLSRVAAAGP